MKYTIPLLLATVAEAFLAVPPGQGLSTLKLYQQKSSSQTSGEGKVLRDLDSARQEWKEEAAHLRAMEHSIEDDPDLDGLVEHKKPAQKYYVEKESHLHDSLFSEIEHAIETDPDLANIVAKKEKKMINNDFMEKEAHVHDNLLTEIEHSVDMDPDLSF